MKAHVDSGGNGGRGTENRGLRGGRAVSLIAWLGLGLLAAFAPVGVSGQPPAPTGGPGKSKGLRPRPAQPRIIVAPPAKTSDFTVPMEVETYEGAGYLLVEVPGLVQIQDIGEVFSSDPLRLRHRLAVPLLPGRNRIILTPVVFGVRGPSIETRVLRDETAPTLHLDFPKEGDTVCTMRIAAYGRFSDDAAACGMGVDLEFLDGATSAHVERDTHGTFLATDVLLQQDPRFPNDPTRKVMLYGATDPFGNFTGQQRVGVRLDTTSPAITAVSGNAQGGVVGAELQDPLTVSLGAESAGKIVTFKVISGSGMVTPSPGGPRSRTVQVRADHNGEAGVRLVLGKKAGAGIHRVQACATGFKPVTFATSAVARSALRIHLNSAPLRTGETGTRGRRPLEVRVTDGLGNGVGGIPVTFRVIRGGADLDVSREVTVISEGLGARPRKGTAATRFNHPVNEGVSIVEATFPGNAGLPVQFEIRTLRPKADRPTLVTGIVRDDTGRPVSNVVVKVRRVGSETEKTVRTDSKGRYRVTLDPRDSGFTTIRVIHVSGFPDETEVTETSIYVIPGETNTVRELHVITRDPANRMCLDDSAPVTLTDPRTKTAFFYVPGIATDDTGARPSFTNPFEFSADPVPTDRINHPLFGGARLLGGFHLGSGTGRPYHFDALPFSMPNPGLSPGEKVEIWGIPPGGGEPEVVGSGSVAGSGAWIQSDPGSGAASTGPLIIGAEEYRTSRVVGRLDTSFRPTPDFCESVFQQNFAAAVPCEDLFDGTVPGWNAYQQCVRTANQSVDQVIDNAGSLSGNVPLDGSGDARRLAVNGFRRVYQALDVLGGPSLTATKDQINVTVLQTEGLRTTEKAPLTLHRIRALLDFTVPVAVDHVTPGDTVTLDPRVVKRFLGTELPVSEYTTATFEVIDARPFSNVIVEGVIRIAANHADLQKTASIGGRETFVQPDGRFSVPNVPLGETGKNRIVIVGFLVPMLPITDEPCGFLHESDPFSFVADGITDVGTLALDFSSPPVTEIVLDPEDLSLAEGSGASLTVTGIVPGQPDLDVSLDATYQPSNPGIVGTDGAGGVFGAGGGNGTVTVVRDGQRAVATVTVDAMGHSTTVEGRVVEPGGAPVSGANVKIFPDEVTTTTLADGTFSLTFVPGDQDRTPLSVLVTASGPSRAASVSGVTPLLDRITDVGTIVLDPATFWIADTDGNLDDDANWSDGAPGPGVVAVVDRSPANPVITVRDLRQIKELMMRERSRVVAPGVLTTTRPLVVATDVELAGGVLRDMRCVDGGGKIRGISSQSTLDNVVLDVDLSIGSGSTVIVRNGLTTSQTIELNSGLTNAVLLPRGGAQTIAGTGEIRMQGVQGRSFVSPLDGPVTFRIPIRGFGNVGSSSSTTILEADVISDVAGKTIRVEGLYTSNATLLGKGGGHLEFLNPGTNDGVVRQEGGGTLTLPGLLPGSGVTQVLDSNVVFVGRYDPFLDPSRFQQSGSVSLIMRGAMNLNNRTFDTSLAPPGVSIRLEGTIEGGTLTGDVPLQATGNPCLLDGVTVGPGFCLDIMAGVTVAVRNDLVLDGKVRLGITGTFAQLLFEGDDARLGGTGNVEFGDASTLNFLAPAGTKLTLEESLTVLCGRGTIGTSTGAVIQKGVLDVPSDSLNLVNVVNQGSVEIGPQGVVFTLGVYSQTAGQTLNEGVLHAVNGIDLSGGDLLGNGIYRGDIVNSARFTAAGGAEIMIDGRYTQTDTGDLVIEIGGTNPGDFGRIATTGGCAFDGTVTIRLRNGFVPGPGLGFEVATYPSVQGGFSGVNDPPGGNVRFVPDFGNLSLRLDTVPNR